MNIFGDGHTAGTGDHRVKIAVSKFRTGFCHQIEQCLSDIGKMSFVIGKKDVVVRIQNGYLDGSGADINT